MQGFRQLGFILAIFGVFLAMFAIYFPFDRLRAYFRFRRKSVPINIHAGGSMGSEWSSGCHVYAGEAFRRMNDLMTSKSGVMEAFRPRTAIPVDVGPDEDIRMRVPYMVGHGSFGGKGDIPIPMANCRNCAAAPVLGKPVCQYCGTPFVVKTDKPKKKAKPRGNMIFVPKGAKVVVGKLSNVENYSESVNTIWDGRRGDDGI